MAAHLRYSTGVGRGGARRGAGRKKGSLGPRGKISVEILERVRAEAQELPIERLLRRMNDKRLPERYRDQLAALVAPYTAPRQTAVSVRKRPGQMTDEEIGELIGVTQEDMLRLGIGRGKWPQPLH